MKILLDTNAYVALMRGDKKTVRRVKRAERVFLSAIVAGELLFGFRNGSRFEKNMGDLETFLENAYVEFLAVSLTTADRFGRIAASLRLKGTPLPTNDIWIAAHVIESGAELLSFDRHFEAIEGLVWTHL
jgi:tRNA(fMet)-specific endonuclease VapC